MLSMLRAIMPREDSFFPLFASHAETIVAGADALEEMFAGSTPIAEACERITGLERKADDITRAVLRAARRSFITPFDRSAITDLISSMDDAIDEMRGTAKAIARYDVTAFEPRMGKVAALAGQAARLVAQAVPLLRSVGKNGEELERLTEEIVTLESAADGLYEEGLKALFHEHGDARPMAYFVGREIYSHLERVLDRLEDVSNEIQGLAIDHA